MSGFTILMSVFKALKFVWPFITEMFFASKSLKQIIMDNKLAIVLLVFLVSSLFLNYLSFSKIYEIAVARRENDIQKKVLKNKAQNDKPVAEEPPPPNSLPAASEPAEIINPHDNLRKRLENIYKSEK